MSKSQLQSETQTVKDQWDTPRDLRSVERPVEPLLPRIARGDLAAVRPFLDRFGRLVLGLSQRYLGRGPDAEDAVQEIFIELWKKADRFDPAIGSELAYVALLARSRLLDARRKLARRPKFEPVLSDQAHPPESNPYEMLDEVRLARHALLGLRVEHRRVIELAFESGLSHDEISTETGLPLGTVKTYIRRGLLKIRERLQLGQGELR